MLTELTAENKILAERIKRLETKVRQLQELQRMIGHDLRGPVNTIGSLLELVEVDPKEEIESVLPMLKDVASKAEQIINGLMEIAELHMKEDIAFDVCDVRAVAEEVINSGKINMQGVIVQYNLSVPVIEYPKIYLHTVLYNLISNAVKYRSNNNCEIEIGTSQQNGKTILYVKDNGVGFDAEKNKKALFKPGKIFHAGYEGKGLGLFLTKNIVEKFDGAISLESEVNKGTTVTISLKA